MSRSLKTISGEYIIDSGLTDIAGEYAMALRAKKALVVSDENVFPIYGERLLAALEEEGLRTEFLIFPAGEGSKSLENFESILKLLNEKNFSRSDVLVALGGGVTGDLGGFAASCFKRGMKLIQFPTSLLAMVDSSIGGKTGVDFGGVKNSVGSFYEPQLTLCDIDCLRTLPERELRCGSAEVIKYAVLFDEELFSALEADILSRDPAEVIYRCSGMKINVVREDFRDTGRRQLLNLGHTIGHAAEILSGFSLAHGEAVAAGMALIMKAAVNKGLCDEASYDRLLKLLDKSGLPASLPYGADEVLGLVMMDKKRSGSRITLAVPRKIGCTELMNIKIDEFKDWLIAGGLK